MLDKRNYRRFNYENSIFLKFQNGLGKTIEGKLLDISFIGLSIFLKENVDVSAMLQEVVQFDFPISVEHHLAGTAKVVHLSRHRLYAENGFRIGLRFIEVDNETVISILNRLESKIIEQIRKKDQISGKNPELF